MVLNTNPWNMLGHDWAVDLLRGHLANGRVRHAYLITGPQGVGRRTLALRFAQAVNCPHPPEPGVPCGTCRSCHLIDTMQHPDLTITQAEQVGGRLKVDQIRQLQHSLALSPYEATYRLALILRFEEANPNAANALLKTLEEPAERVILLLTALDPESLLPTIVSRCELIRLRPLPLETTSQGLQTCFNIPAEEANVLAHISGGRPGYALRLHQNPETVHNRQTWLTELRNLLTANRVERFAYAESLARDKEQLDVLLQVWMSFWRDVMLCAAGSSAPLINLEWKTEIETLAQRVGLEQAKNAVKLMERTQKRLQQNVNTRLAAEVMMLDLPHL